jgi:hypothetical protein
MKLYYHKETQEYDTESLVKLIDSFIICAIPCESSKLHQTVLDVQKHNHTKKCKIINSYVCKYKFPKFPSKRTIIAEPLKEDIDNE